jgi:hypothetical protein
MQAFLFKTVRNKLFQFSFFVQDMLTSNWIKFLDLHFLRHGTFVFSSGIEMTCTST